jgi:hypothetical protein
MDDAVLAMKDGRSRGAPVQIRHPLGFGNAGWGGSGGAAVEGRLPNRGRVS